jgi:hypothetical protein
MQTRYESILTLENARQWQAETEKFLFIAGLLEFCNLPATMTRVLIVEEYFAELLNKA